MGVDRRGFLKAILAAAAAPAVVRADSLMKVIPRNVEVFTWHQEPIVIDQMRDLQFLEGTQWSEAQIDAMNMRATARANLSEWLANQLDRVAFTSLTGIIGPEDSGSPIILPKEKKLVLLTDGRGIEAVQEGQGRT